MLNRLLNRPWFNKLVEAQFFLAWMACAVLPKKFVKVLFVGEIALFFLLFLGHFKTIYKYMTISKPGRTVYWLWMVFFAIAAIYLWLSYKDIPYFWRIPLLLYDQEYIYRQYMIIPELIVPLGLGFILARTGTIYKSNSLFLFLFLTGVTGLYYSGFANKIMLSGLVVALSSLLALKTRNYIYLILIPLVISNHSAYNIAAAAILGLIVLRRPMKAFLAHHTTWRIIFLLIVAASLMYYYSDELYEKITTDENSLWRLRVWENEINSLSDTYYTGVGFGTTYVTYDIYTIVNNPNMYFDKDRTLYGRLFMVANHNSFLNMFYRMGLWGGFVFLLLNISICSYSIHCYRKAKEFRKYIWWAFSNFVYQIIIILLNPGLEMMQFAINYMGALSLLIGVNYSHVLVMKGKHSYLHRLYVKAKWRKLQLKTFIGTSLR